MDTGTEVRISRKDLRDVEAVLATCRGNVVKAEAVMVLAEKALRTKGRDRRAGWCNAKDVEAALIAADNAKAGFGAAKEDLERCEVFAAQIHKRHSEQREEDGNSHKSEGAVHHRHGMAHR